MKPAYLFVYGTLDPQHAPPVIRPATLRLMSVGNATVRGRLFDFGRYPGLVLEADAEFVYGRLFELPEDAGETLAAFDLYEGYTATAPERSLFTRVQAPVDLNGRSLAAWVYVYTQSIDRGRHVAGGRWRSGE